MARVRTCESVSSSTTRQYIVRGLDPMGVLERRADIEHAETGELIRVPIAELEKRWDGLPRRWLH